MIMSEEINTGDKESYIANFQKIPYYPISFKYGKGFV